MGPKREEYGLKTPLIMHKPGLSGGEWEKVPPHNSFGLHASPFSAPSVVANSFFSGLHLTGERNRVMR